MCMEGPQCAGQGSGLGALSACKWSSGNLCGLNKMKVVGLENAKINKQFCSTQNTRRGRGLTKT